MDSASEEGFNKKLSNLKSRWDEMDGANCSNAFYEWFVKCNVIVSLLFLVTHILSRKKIEIKKKNHSDKLTNKD